MMKVEVKKVEKNDLTGECYVTLRTTDPNYIRSGINENDPEIHTITYTSFSCKESELEDRIKQETYNIWLKHSPKHQEDPKELLGTYEYELDERTGTLKKLKNT